MAIYWGLFKSNITYSHRKTVLAEKVCAEKIIEKLVTHQCPDLRDGCHYYFDCVGNPFNCFFDFRWTIKKEFLNILSNKLKRFNCLHNNVVVHVRRGDFKVAGLVVADDELKSVFEKIRETYPNKEIYLVTDALRRDHEFWKIVPKWLHIKPTSRNPLEDLLFMVNACEFVAQSNSSYSRFAAYVSEQPVKWYGPSNQTKRLTTGEISSWSKL